MSDIDDIRYRQPYATSTGGQGQRLFLQLTPIWRVTVKGRTFLPALPRAWSASPSPTTATAKPMRWKSSSATMTAPWSCPTLETP